MPEQPLQAVHQQAGAETQPYDTFEIVATFGEPQAEYAAIRKAAALQDLVQRGVVELTGPDRHAFLNNLLTNATVDRETKAGLVAGQVVYAFLLNLKGRVVADVNVIELGDRTLLEVDGRLVDMLVSLLNRYLFAERVTVRAAADLYEIAVHGPGAVGLLQQEADAVPAAAGRCAAFNVIGVPVVAWADDPCGVPGVHLIVPRGRVVDLWQHLLARHGGEISLGKRALRPVGWAAFNATRIEAGRPLFGIDFDLAPPSFPGKKADADAAADTAAPADARPVGVLPAETGLLDRAVSFTKGCYLGQEVVARMHARQQVARKLVGLRVDDDALPIAGAHATDAKQAVVGVVTSSTMSPVLSDAAIALALVRKPFFEPGQTVLVPAEGAVRSARVVPLPFFAKID